jgi:hypothetical protein
MRRMKRHLLLAGELAILGLGLFFSAMAALSVPFPASPLVFIGCLGFCVAGVTRRKPWTWELEDDAAQYGLAKTEGKLHPRRARFKGMAQRVAVWVASAIAAMVVLPSARDTPYTSIR